MEIIIFGATGGTGKQLVKQALQLGHLVTAFVRDAASIAIDDERLSVQQGNVENYDAVFQAIQPYHLVLVALGAKSPFKGDARLISGMQNIVKTMESKGSSRIIYLSFAGVKETKNNLPFPFQQISATVLRNVSTDHEAKETTLKQSSLQWTIVRPALLTNGPHTGRVNADENLSPSLLNLMISRANVADFMLRQLTDNVFLRKGPLIISG